MPIAPENLDRYPADWKTRVVPMIRERSGGRCECRGECGQRHGPLEAPPVLPIEAPTRPDPVESYVARNGLRYPLPPRCTALNYKPHPVTDSRVVLTVAHLDHQPENCAPENLRHMCQRCHLRYDQRHHVETRARSGHAAASTADLFDQTKGKP